jgi:hypothetical protein
MPRFGKMLLKIKNLEEDIYDQIHIETEDHRTS